ncbi:MAG TPA: hypothetical protein VJ816_11390 [Gemmatimonadales bacterium]|nr:hypothetical protein [Gemmatimonadales bacterium]
MRHEDDEYAAQLGERVRHETRAAAAYGVVGTTQTPSQTSIRKSDIVGFREHLERIEGKLDALILALKAGAIGRWQ